MRCNNNALAAFIKQDNLCVSCFYWRDNLTASRNMAWVSKMQTFLVVFVSNFVLILKYILFYSVSGQLPPRKIFPRIIALDKCPLDDWPPDCCPAGICPRGKLPPGWLPQDSYPKGNCSLTISPWKLPPEQNCLLDDYR